MIFQLFSVQNVENNDINNGKPCRVEKFYGAALLWTCTVAANNYFCFAAVASVAAVVDPLVMSHSP